MSEHTKTPWKIDKELGSRSGEWLIAMDAGDKGRGIAIARTVEGSGKELKNALTIVHRVNAYERLVEALEQMHAIAEFREARNPQVIVAGELLAQLQADKGGE